MDVIVALNKNSSIWLQIENFILFLYILRNQKVSVSTLVR